MTEGRARIAEFGPQRFRRYPDYRDSGVEWLGEIPAHWEVRPLKTLASIRPSNVDKKSKEGEVPVRLCNYVDVYYNDFITAELEFMSATATPEQARRFQLRAGDVLITKDSESWNDIAVSTFVPEDLPEVLCGYHLAQIQPGPDLDGRFLARQFSAIGPRDQFYVAANGITRFGLGGAAIRTGLFAVAPLEEQRVIVAFVNRETAKIDALVEKQERLIELLQEKRTALITRAVTRGLDPNVPMKDSGVEWLEEIPSHWETPSLGRVTVSRCDGPFGSGLKSEHYSDSGIRVVRLQNIGWADFINLDAAYLDEAYARRLGDHSVKGADILIAGLGDDGHPVGRACVAPVEIEPAMVKADCFRFRLDRQRVLPRYAAFQLSATASAVSGYHATGATRTRMNLTTSARRKIALPPVEEQRAIAIFLDYETAKVDTLVAKVRQAVEHLKEYRTALISAAVTGKIDVRNEAA